MTRLKGDCDETGYLDKYFAFEFSLENMTRLKGDCDFFFNETVFFILFHLLENMTRLKGDCDLITQVILTFSNSWLENMTRLKGDCDSFLFFFRLGFLQGVGEHDPIKRGLRQATLLSLGSNNPSELENMTRLKGDCDWIPSRNPSLSRIFVGEHDPIKRGLRLLHQRSNFCSSHRGLENMTRLKGDCDLTHTISIF